MLCCLCFEGAGTTLRFVCPILLAQAGVLELPLVLRLVQLFSCVVWLCVRVPVEALPLQYIAAGAQPFHSCGDSYSAGGVLHLCGVASELVPPTACAL